MFANTLADPLVQLISDLHLTGDEERLSTLGMDPGLAELVSAELERRLREPGTRLDPVRNEVEEPEPLKRNWAGDWKHIRPKEEQTSEQLLKDSKWRVRIFHFENGVVERIDGAKPDGGPTLTREDVMAHLSGYYILAEDKDVLVLSPVPHKHEKRGSKPKQRNKAV